MRLVFLDTETTGLDAAAGDRVVEIGCVELVNRRPTGRNLHFHVNPERANHEDALKVHGLTDEFLADKPLFAHVVEDLLAFLRDAEIVIHNAAFDTGFLDAELRRIGRPALAGHVHRVTCSLTMARSVFPGKQNSLDALCKRFEVNNSARKLHGALLDAELLAEVYIRMTRGQDSLVIDGDDAFAIDDVRGAADFGSLELLVLGPDDDELAAHAALIADIDKASGGHAVWALAAAHAMTQSAPVSGG